MRECNENWDDMRNLRGLTSPHVAFVYYIIMNQTCSMDHLDDLGQPSMFFGKIPEP